MKNPLHSSLSNEHFSPASIIEPARAVLGTIDLDPASCEFAQGLVQAGAYFTQAYNGLKEPWAGTVFLNPPGGKYDKDCNPVAAGRGRSAAAVWWAKLVKEWEAGRVHSAIFVCFSLNLFRTAQSECELAPYMCPFVVLGDRVRFDRDVNGVRTPGKAPQQDSAIVYLPPLDDGTAAHRFSATFSHLGAVRL